MSRYWILWKSTGPHGKILELMGRYWNPWENNGPHLRLCHNLTSKPSGIYTVGDIEIKHPEMWNKKAHLESYEVDRQCVRVELLVPRKLQFRHLDNFHNTVMPS
jgi:hypothetical protein